ncbi:MAG TPA: ribonuclease P protein component [Candidatus Latescibacteria bacterium]|nr:ribonuclease P protein component [Candidatus Latescibacterota bacterium]HJN29010.1 ribonuclease P protein component [Candidatus Latescibacterota bacterium]
MRDGREDDGTIFVIRKALGNAVVRNRLKRRLRHIMRDLDAPASGSIVLLARPSAVRLSFAALERQVTELLDRLHEAPTDAAHSQH